ncbi:MAG TPA: tRNA lysidine(34) synthetase TilS [Solirubrobacterales bacterium]|nr:tRNA lysidine(34) synthetase TilS [Solirubrobacterales bacterium]
MRESKALSQLVETVERTALLRVGSDGVVLLSGGADSACLAAAAVEICGPQSVSAVHLNYGLREDSDRGEEAARALCAQLRIDLHIERPELEEGNLQARARAVRYEVAERLRAKLGAAWIATGHTRTDLAETLLYRLAVSPGTRALGALRARNGVVLRPLLDLARTQTRAAAAEARLPFADDSSNDRPLFARNVIRAEVLPRLAEIGPELERNVAETQGELLEDAALIDELAGDAIRAAGSEGGAPLRHEELTTMHPALRRAVLTQLAERESGGRPVRIDRARAARILRLAADPEGGVVELGRGLCAIAEAGTVRFATERASQPPEPVRLTIPGRARYGDWEIRAELAEPAGGARGPELATLDADRLGGEVEIRCWREGDRIRPLGLGGSKSLQDLFTDSGVPRSLRQQLPVLVADEEIAWVAGVAVSEEFRLEPESARSAVITATAMDEQRS